MIKKYWWVGVTAAIFLLTGAFVLSGRRGSEAAQAIYSRVQVSRTTLSIVVDGMGNIEPAATFDLNSPADGKLLDVLVEPGDYVTKGQVLVRIDTADSVLQLTQAQTSYNQAELSYIEAERDYQRVQKLFDAQAVTKQQLESAYNQYKAAGESLQSAKAKLDEALTAAGGRNRSGITAVMTAPRDGLITAVNGAAGATVSARSPLVTLADPSRLAIVAEVDENDVLQIEPGQEVRIVLTALPDEEFTGRVAGVGGLGQSQNGVVVFTVKIEFNDPSRRAKPGMSADVAIVVAERREVLSVPNNAIETRMGSPAVRIYKGPDECEYRRVKLGLRTDIATEILSGLDEEEYVAIPAVRGSSGQIPPNSGRNGGFGGGGMMRMPFGGR